MSCAVMNTHVSMSSYMSCKNCVYKESYLLCFVFFFSSCNLLYSIQNIKLASDSSVSSDSFISSMLIQCRPSLFDTSI